MQISEQLSPHPNYNNHLLSDLPTNSILNASHLPNILKETTYLKPLPFPPLPPLGQQASTTIHITVNTHKHTRQKLADSTSLEN